MQKYTYGNERITNTLWVTLLSSILQVSQYLFEQNYQGFFPNQLVILYNNPSEDKRHTNDTFSWSVSVKCLLNRGILDVTYNVQNLWDEIISNTLNVVFMCCKTKPGAGYATWHHVKHWRPMHASFMAVVVSVTLWNHFLSHICQGE